MMQLPIQHTPRLQRGQALAEALVVMLALLSLWVASSWLLNIQDIGLQTMHASRHTAFAAVQGTPDHGLGMVRRHAWSGPAHLWKNRRGALLLGEQGQGADLALLQQEPLGAHGQPGGASAWALTLRSDWQLADRGLVTARMRARLPLAAYPLQLGAALGLAGLRSLDASNPTITRSLSILMPTDTPVDDADAQQRLGSSAGAWRDAAERSGRLGAAVQAAVQAADAAWRRPEPDRDWLGLWADIVPQHHLQGNGGTP